MKRMIGDWLRLCSKLVFLLLLLVSFVKFGVFSMVSSLLEEEDTVSITASYTGEGVVEVYDDNGLLISGAGNIIIPKHTNIKMRITCKGKNLIDYVKVDDLEREFTKGQCWEEELSDISKDTEIQIGFLECNTVMITNDDRYQLEFDKVEYSCHVEKTDSFCYYYNSDSLGIKVIPKKYWFMKEVQINGQVNVPDEVENFKQYDEYYTLLVNEQINSVKFVLDKERIPVTIKYGTGELKINGISVKDGDRIERCSEYNISYTVPEDTIVLDKLFVNGGNTNINDDVDDWRTSWISVSDNQPKLTLHILENEYKVVPSLKDYFKTRENSHLFYWPKKYNSIYLKQKNINISTLDDIILDKLQADKNISYQKKSLHISGLGTIDKIAIDGRGGNFMSSTPIQFLYDSTAPTISDYYIQNDKASKEQNNLGKITVSAKDTGSAGIDQVLYGTYEEYQSFVETTASGEYESLHEKAEPYLEVAFDRKNSQAEEEYYTWAIDCAANISEAVKLDLQGPVLQCETEDKWHNRDFQVTGSANEEIKHIFYSSSYEVYLEHTLGDDYREGNAESERETGQQIGRSKSKNWTFSVLAKENKTQTYYIWAYDQYGNKSKVPCVYETKVDTTPPELILTRSIPEGQWSKDVITLHVKGMEKDTKCNSGLSQVYYSSREDLGNPVALTNASEDGEFVIQSPSGENGQPLEMDRKYYFWALDYAGNQSMVIETKIQVDTISPSLTDIQIVSKSGKELIQRTPYGICSKGSLLFYVGAKDEGDSSGLGSMHLYQDNKHIGTALGNQGIYQFEISKPFVGEVCFQIEDNVGHMSPRMTIEQLDTTIISSYIRLEMESPQVTLTAPPADYTDKQGNDWYKQDVKLSFELQDPGSGIQEVKTWINDQEIEVDMHGKALPRSSAPMRSSQYIISTSQVEASQDGSYCIRVKATDYCGNVTEETKVLYIDRFPPVIEQFTFTTKEKTYQQKEMVKKDLYGYYFEEKTRVRIQAGEQVASSGIRAICYYTIDYGKDIRGVKSPVVEAETDVNGGIEIILSGGFKGQIYAKALDYVGHKTEYKKPYGVIIESVKANSNTANVSFLMPGTKWADGKGQPLYGKDVELNFTAQDYFNGIKKVEWEVTSPQDGSKNQKGQIEIDQNGNLEDIGKAVIVTRDSNLVTSLKQRIIISNNSNDIKVMVRITDSSGHIFQKEIVFSIDKTKPEISVIVPDKSVVNGKEYFNKIQVVQIRVKERNFDPKLVTASIYNDLEGAYQLSPWTELRNQDRPDESIYTASIVCQEDGAYTIKGMVVDLAGNEGAMVEEEFVIDQKSPQVSLSFSSAPSVSDAPIFYAKSQLATITLKEHNFDPSKVKILCKRVRSLQDKTELPAPTISEFISKGDYHTTTLSFHEDGWYAIEITVADKAGNDMEETFSQVFGIDTYQPSIQVTGVIHRSANNDKLCPRIDVWDDNYEEGKVKVLLSGTKSGQVTFVLDQEKVKVVNGSNKISNLARAGKITIERIKADKPSAKGHGQGHQWVLNCFPIEEELDDLYTLTIEAEDTAGNHTSQTIEFSVNRFGSIYTFSSQLEKMTGTYVKAMDNVVFTEINVNSLVKEETQIKLSRNGVVSDLIENQDYTITKDNGENQWNRYLYELDKELFQEEGRYTITVHSKDISGNVNANDLSSKKAEIVFGVDKTNPIIAASNLKENSAYNTTSKQAMVVISDNIGVKDASIYVNNKKIDYQKKEDIYRFVLPLSNREQNIKIVAEDSAGNITTREFPHIYVTTNSFIRLFHNRPFLIFIALFGILFVLGSGFFILRRQNLRIKSKEDKSL